MIGGRAANFYRPTPRFTRDVDFYVTRLQGVREFLETAGFTIVKSPRGDGNELLQIVAEKPGIRFDFNLADFEYQFDAIERAKANEGVIVVEDVIIQKLLAWRPTDRDDLEAIVGSGIEIDFELVRRWCDQFETTERLDLLMQSASGA